ncbi:MAG: redoxin domain-containing protein [Alphaproteobacteria bacterium]|nr:redoxin domain-containing protein [Alphaproteobacteria bacterium]
MLKAILPVFALALLTGAPAIAQDDTQEAPQAVVGQPAPDFEAVTIDGSTVKLSDLQGQPVVLEWTNHECPFVVKHYSAGNMQATQQMATDDFDAHWITIVSSAPGNQGHVSAEEAQSIMDDAGANATAKVLDESGKIGKLYGASTTPHMFVIDAEGTLVYAGAIDSVPSPSPADIENAENYVIAALKNLAADEPVATPQTQPYGCSVKY